MNDAHGLNDLAGVKFGIGAWQWGDRLFWGYNRDYTEQDCRDVFNAALGAGLIFFDTAETYGQGKSESLLGQFMRETDQKVIIATKFMPFPWRLTRKSLENALRASLNRLGVKFVDLYQIHQPFPPVKVETWMDAMLEAVQLGLIKAVGVSNYSSRLMMRAQDALGKAGVTLFSNQVEYNLLERSIEKKGLLADCQSAGIRVIAYSPLAQGMLTGKYSPEVLPRGFRANKYSRGFLKEIQPLISLLKKIGSDHGGKNAAQVAINWVICKGGVPIPGAKNQEQIELNLGALGWQLTKDEVALLDETSDLVVRIS